MVDINPRYLEINGAPIQPPQSTVAVDKQNTVLDNSWAKIAFLVNNDDLSNPVDIVNRTWSSASLKFTDCRMGANIGINARPQYTRYSDIRSKGRLPGRDNVTPYTASSNQGMGRYYSESEDDNAQIIYMRFGVPQFNSLANFLKNAFDPDLTSYVRTGRAPSIWYNLGKATATVLQITALPTITMSIMAAEALTAFILKPTSKFYTLKPTMFQYWTAVNTLVNALAVNMGLMPRCFEGNTNQVIGTSYGLDQDYLNALNVMMPDIFNSQNGIDVMAIANKGQRLANNVMFDENAVLNNSFNGAGDFLGYIYKADTISPITGQPQTIRIPSGTYGGLGMTETYPILQWINKVTTLGYYTSGSSTSSNASSSTNADGSTTPTAGTNDSSDMEVDPRLDKDTGEPLTDKYEMQTKFGNYFDAEFRDGSNFAVFRVDNTGSISESFSNSTVESDLSNKLNSMASSARETRFTFADGNMGSDLVSQTIENVASAASDFAKGALDKITLGLTNGISAITGSGYIDIPKHWQSSSVSLPRSTYTMQLIAPYGNIISKLQNIYIPLCMLMAGSLPLSTGSTSYTSPFLVQLYDRGRCQIQLGMIESLSITRGTANLPFNNKGGVMAVDVSFSIIDLSTIMHMPISTGSLFNISRTGNRITDEDNILMDYLAVLAGQDIYSQIYALPKAKLAFAKMINLNYEQLTSPAYHAAFFHEEMTSGLLGKTLFGSAANILEGLLPPSAIITSH